MPSIQKDKVGHLIAGFLIALVLGYLYPLLGVSAAFLAGWLKEKYDERRPLFHTYDGWDAYATALGAVPALALLTLVK